MTKEKFICLCQEYPINLTFEEAKELANNAIQKNVDFSLLYNSLHRYYYLINTKQKLENIIDEDYGRGIYS